MIKQHAQISFTISTIKIFSANPFKVIFVTFMCVFGHGSVQKLQAFKFFQHSFMRSLCQQRNMLCVLSVSFLAASGVDFVNTIMRVQYFWTKINSTKGWYDRVNTEASNTGFGPENPFVILKLTFRDKLHDSRLASRETYMHKEGLR